MSAIVELQEKPSQRSALLWLVPLQAAALFTVLAIISGGQTLRAWLLGAFTWAMALPLLVSLEASLIAMMWFEPVRGLLRRAQYLFVDYASQDPIHLVTPIVTVLAFAMLLKTYGTGLFRATPLAGPVSVLGLIYFVEVFNPLQGSLFVGLAGALFMLVPLVWFYFGQSVKEEFVARALKIVIVLGILTSLYGLYQLVVGYPAFEQYWIDNTDYYDSIAVGHIKRALATFSSAEEWGRYTEIGAIAAFGFFAGAKRFLGRGLWLASGAALSVSVLLTGQRTAVFGLLLGVAMLVLLGARTWRGTIVRLTMLLLPLVLTVVLVKAPAADDMWSKGDTETFGTLLSHTQRGTLKPADEESFQARLGNWTYLVTRVIPYRPFGAGLGAGSLSEARFNQDSNLPAIDSFILTVAVACGIPGALLFCWILFRSTWLSISAVRRAPPETNILLKRIVASLMPVLILNSMFGLTFTLYSVAPIAWMLIGWISAETSRSRRAAAREIITI